MEETFAYIVKQDFPEKWPEVAAGVVDCFKNCANRESLRSPLLVLSLLVESYSLVREISK